MSDTISEIERRLRHEKQMSRGKVEMVMSVVEEEILGETDRDGVDYKVVGDGRLYNPDVEESEKDG